jgi:GT2 family glycosyltransferase
VHDTLGRCRLSVIVPTYQRCASLERTLAALSRQTVPPTKYEVIVVIDGSCDGSWEMVKELSTPYNLRAICQPNQGRASACNTGIRAATGELLLIMDDDIEPTPECLAAHLRVHEGDARVGAMGAVPVVLEKLSFPVARYIHWKFDGHFAKLARPGYELRLRDFSTQNFSIRRDVVLDVGAFDEALFTIYGNEDLEMSVRLRSAGVRLIYCPDAVAYQHYTKDFAALARDNVAKGRTAVLFAAKHPGTIAELKLSQYRVSSRKWRILRAGLLTTSKILRMTPQFIILLTSFLERHVPLLLDRYYLWAVDYFFWLGVEAQLAETVADAPPRGGPATRTEP